MSTLGSWSHHVPTGPTRHFTKGTSFAETWIPKILSTWTKNQTMAIYGNQNNSRSSKCQSKMSNQNGHQNALARFWLGTQLGRTAWISVSPKIQKKLAELTIFYEVTIYIRILHKYIDLWVLYTYIYIYTIYTKHNMIIYPLVISYSHSYAFRWIQRCSDLPSVPAVRSTRASDWLPPVRVAPVEMPTDHARTDPTRQIWLRGRWVRHFEVFNQGL